MQGANFCADGGGIRGYSSLLILKALMQMIKRLESRPQNGVELLNGGEAQPPNFDLEDRSTLLFPCHYFDYIFGTSTGGYEHFLEGADSSANKKTLI